MMKKFLFTLLIGCSALCTMADDSILDIKHSLNDSKIVPPESFETDVQKMKESWYLQNYVQLDENHKGEVDNTLNDQEIIDRLDKLPCVIEMTYNPTVLSFIKMYIRKNELVETMLGKSLYYMPIFEQELEKRGMPEELKYLAVVESALIPTARSRANAVGLWQFMRPTAKGLGLEINNYVDERRDTYKATAKAVEYLQSLYKTYGDWHLAIAAYNSGPGNVNKAIRRSGQSKYDFWTIYDYLLAETRSYVPTFIAACYIMNYYNVHNISPALAKRPLITDTVHVNNRIHFDQISEILDIPVEEIRALNPQYLKDVIPGHIHTYTLTLPSQQIHSFIMSLDKILEYKADKYNPQHPEYETREVVKYHTVKRGETLKKVARTYGVSQKEIKQWNGLRKNTLKRGQRLKIITTQKVRIDRNYKPKVSPQQLPTDEDSIVTNNSTTAQTDSIVIENGQPEQQEVATVQAQETKPETNNPKPEIKKKPTKEQQYTWYKVRKGDNLGKIAQRYGVTVKQIQRLNGIKGTRINVGQRLRIPKK